MKQIIISLLLLFAVNSLSAQFSVHLSYSEATKSGIGVGYDFSKRFWSDLTLARWITDSEAGHDRYSIDNISADISIKYNFISKNFCDMYLGVGTLFTIESAPEAFFTVPVGIRIRPFEKLNNIAFQIELQPAMRTDIDDCLFGKLGIHYQF